MTRHPFRVDRYSSGEIVPLLIDSAGLVRAATCITAVGVLSATRGLPSDTGARVVRALEKAFGGSGKLTRADFPVDRIF